MYFGDKLALISHNHEGKICCLYLIPVNDLSSKTTKLMLTSYLNRELSEHP
jgi:hypothetical protein